MSGSARKVTVFVSLAVLGGSMLVPVRRSAEVREVARDIQRLEARAAEMRERRARASRTEDSLSSRSRIREVASQLGFRVPADSMVHFVAAGASSDAGEGP